MMRYYIYLAATAFFLDFHSNPDHRATTFAQNHYNMVNATEQSSRNKQTNVTMQLKMLENMAMYIG